MSLDLFIITVFCCQHFRGEAAFSKDTLTRQTFYGFRVHVKLCWPGIITQFELAPANPLEADETEAALVVHSHVAHHQDVNRANLEFPHLE
jgi:hypothetical protein